MTARTMLLKLRTHTKTKGINDLAEALGWDKGSVSAALNEMRSNTNMQIATLQKFSKNTGITIGQLAEWWAEADPGERFNRY